jgi:hypothetical protein
MLVAIIVLFLALHSVSSEERESLAVPPRKLEKTNHYKKALYFNGKTIPTFSKNGLKPISNLNCHRWAVVSTNIPPTDAIRKIALLSHWCLVVVSDHKELITYAIESPHNNSFFLDKKGQEELLKSFSFPMLPSNHVSRKNVGYLFATLHGAKEIFDFGDDVVLITKHHHLNLVNPEASANAPSLTVRCNEPSQYQGLVLNPFHMLGAESHACWPRGFPLLLIKTNSSSAADPIPVVQRDVETKSIAIMQVRGSLSCFTPQCDRLQLPIVV